MSMSHCPNGCENCPADWQPVIHLDTIPSHTLDVPFICPSWIHWPSTPTEHIIECLKQSSEVVELVVIDNGTPQLIDAQFAFGQLYKKEPLGYIKAWEYEASEVDLLVLEPPFVPLQNIIPQSVCTLMKWIYAGYGGHRSDQHIDPLCTAAWLCLCSGIKRWRLFKPKDDHDEAQMKQFDLHQCNTVSRDVGTCYYLPAQVKDTCMYVPSRILHEVENIMNSENDPVIAVTHNFLPLDANNAFWNFIKHYILLCLGRNDEVESHNGWTIEEAYEKLDILIFGTLFSLTKQKKENNNLLPQEPHDLPWNQLIIQWKL